MSDEVLPESEDPFVVFGVSSDISDRDLKKRYFALMRLFDPETHPNEFSRIQAAYDQIKDPQARAQLRDGPYPNLSEPYRSRMRDVLTLMNDGRIEFARPQLKTLLEENPGLNEAHFLLGQLELNEGNFVTAEQSFRTLHEREPANLAYWQRLAQSLNRLGRFEDAENLANLWLKTYPKEPAAWRVLADALVGQKHHGVAMARLKDAIAAISADGTYPFELALQRIGFGRWVYGYQLAGDVDELIKAAGADEDIRKHLASDCTALAALYFDRERPDDANVLLRKARELSGRADGLEFPIKITRFIEELPAASLAWLEEETKAPHIHHLKFSGFKTDLAMAAAATFILAVCSSIAFTAATPFDAVGLGFLFVWLGGLTLWAGWAWHRVSWSWKSPLARMTAVHPLFLFEIDYEKITAWSLVTYTSGDVIHHSSNGSYTSSEVQLRFGAVSRSINVKGMQSAVDFVNLIGGWSKRSLELLHGGVLEAEQGADFLPVALLDPKFKSPLQRRRRWELARRWAISTAVAAAITAAVMLVTDARSDERQLTAAVTAQSPEAILTYLAQHPNDTLKKQVSQWHEKQLQGSIGQLVAESLPDDVGRENLALLAASLLENSSRDLPVVIELSFSEAGIDRLVKKGWRVAPKAQLAAWAARADPNWLIPSLDAHLDPRVRVVMSFDSHPRGNGRLLKVALLGHWTEPGIRLGNTDYPSLQLRGTVSLSAAGQTREVPVAVALTREELGALSSGTGDSAVVEAEVKAMLVKLAPDVIDALGLSPGH